MFKFIEDLEKAIKAVSESQIDRVAKRLPHMKQDGGEMVGFLPERLQRLWVHTDNLARHLDAQMAKAEQAPLSTKNELLIFVAKIRTSMKEINNLRSFFWMTVHSEFGLSCTDKFYIGEGWKVYYSKPVCKNYNISRHTDDEDKIPPEISELLNMLEEVANFM